jgi:hypothetical protein
MQDDPVRSLRGVRLALELDLSMESATKSQIRQAGPVLGRVAAERIRDEFMQMLKPALAGRSIRLLERLDLLWHICPDLRGPRDSAGPGRDAWQHTLAALDRAADILRVLVGGLPGELSENLTIGEAAGNSWLVSWARAWPANGGWSRSSAWRSSITPPAGRMSGAIAKRRPRKRAPGWRPPGPRGVAGSFG